jgi:hypothetical protein
VLHSCLILLEMLSHRKIIIGLEQLPEWVHEKFMGTQDVLK